MYVYNVNVCMYVCTYVMYSYINVFNVYVYM